MKKPRSRKSEASPTADRGTESAANSKSAPAWRTYILYGLGFMALLCSYPAWTRALAVWRAGTVRTLLAEGKLTEATRAAQALPDKSLSPGEADYLRAVCSRRNDELLPALSYLKKAKDAGWPEEQIKRQRMMTLFQGGDSAESEPYLVKLADKGGTDDEADELYECMVKGQLAKDRINDARYTLESWLKWRPKNSRANVWLAETYEREQSYKTAAKYYVAALESAPNDRTSRLSLGNVYLADNKSEDAQTQFMLLLAKDDQDGLAKLGLAQCKIRFGKKEEAKQLLESIDPEKLLPNPRGVYYSTLGTLAAEDKQFEKAVAHFETSLKLAPEYIGIHTQLAQAYARLGKAELAAKHLAESKVLFEKQQNLTKLLNDIAANPQNVDLRVEIAKLHIDLSNDVAALSAANAALQLDATCSKAHAILAEIYKRQGNQALAQRHTQLAVQDSDAKTKPNAGK